MQRTPTLSSAAAAGGASGAAGILLVWLLAQFHVEMPADVALAALTLLTPLVHFGMMRLGITTDAAPAAPPTTPTTTEKPA